VVSFIGKSDLSWAYYTTTTPDAKGSELWDGRKRMGLGRADSRGSQSEYLARLTAAEASTTDSNPHVGSVCVVSVNRAPLLAPAALGHTNIKMTSTYLNATDTGVKEAFKKFEAKRRHLNLKVVGSTPLRRLRRSDVASVDS
jgi:hypothetical protein